MCMLLNICLLQPRIVRIKHSIQSASCCFCGNPDKKHLEKVSREITEGLFPFKIYQCQDCMSNEINLRLLKGIMLLRRLHNLFVSIHFVHSIIANPSELYIPFNSFGKLHFLCMSKKCSMRIRCSDPIEFDGDSLRQSSFDCLTNESSIRGCIIDPILGTTETKSVSIAQIIYGVRMLDNMIEFGIKYPFIQSFIEFDSQYPNLTITDSISESPQQEGPRIADFSFENFNSIMELFSLLSSGIYSDDAIELFLSGEMKEGFLKFITDSMISMTAFLRENGFNDCLPELKIKPEISEFLVKNSGSASSTDNIICQNFRNFLKLFRKILRRFYQIDESQQSIDLFQYCCFLYSTLHVRNQRIQRRMTSQSSSRYFEYLERYVISTSPFCLEIFSTIPVSEIKLNNCGICLTEDSASVIGKCPHHNICCLECFPRVVKQSTTCPSCRNPDFLP